MSLFAVLQRRHVIRVAAAYLIIGWLLVQVLDLAAESFEAPVWVMKMIITLVVVGFIPTLLFSWAYELTPEGLKKDSEIDHSAADTSQTGQKLNVVTLVAVAGIVALVGWQQLNPPVRAPVSEPPAEEAITPSLSAPVEPESPVADASIAVLPFADLSPDGDQGYFSDGISEEILNVLVRIKGLRVASRTSAFAYKNSQQRIPEIASELGVRHILEGSVRRAGNSIRVTAQLIDASTDEHLLSETFDRTLTAENVFAIQGEIAQLIAMALSGRIEVEDIGAPVAVVADTENLATLDLYYEAHSLFLLRGRDNLTRAMGLFEQITEKDPDFARGWSGLASVYTVAKDWGLRPRDYDRLARDAAQRAIALNPKLSTPYAVLANVETSALKPDWSEALRNYELALQFNPDNVNLYNWRALFWESTGFVERAFDDFATCLRLDPSYINCDYNRVLLLIVTGRSAEADATHQSLLLRGATAHVRTPVFIQDRVNKGDMEGVLQSLNIIVALGFPEERWMVKELFEAFTDPTFDHAARLEMFDKRLAAADLAGSRQSSVDGATLRVAFRDVDHEEFPNLINLTHIKFFKHFSEEQRRQWIIDRRIPEFWHKQGFPPDCRPVGEDDFECDEL